MDYTTMPNFHISTLPPISAASLNSQIIAAFPEHLALYSNNMHITDFDVFPVHIVKFPNTKQIICASLSTFFVYNIEEMKCVRTISGRNKIKSLCCHNNPALILTGEKDGFVKLWDLRRKDPAFEIRAHKKAVTALDSKQDFCVSGGKEGSVKVCDFRKLGFETVCCNERVTDMSICPSTDRVGVIHSNSLVRIYNLSSFETIQTLACVKSYILKYKTEGLYVLSSNKFTVMNTLGLVHQSNTKWSYPLHLSSNNRVLSRELGIDVWEIHSSIRRPQGIDLAKLDEIEEAVNIRMTVESRALSERSFVTLDGGQNRPLGNIDQVSEAHNKTMFLLDKRTKITNELIELWELGGIGKIFPAITKCELAVQSSIFDNIFNTKPRPDFVAVCNAGAILDICLRLAKSKNKYYAEVAGKCTGIVLMEISQELCASIATNLQVNKNEQVKCVKIFKQLENIVPALKQHKRGIVELNEIEFFIEKLSKRVNEIEVPEEEELGFFPLNRSYPK